MPYIADDIWLQKKKKEWGRSGKIFLMIVYFTLTILQ